MQQIKINQFQAVALTGSSFLPLLYFFVPRTAVQYADYYSFWSVIAAMLVGICMGYLHTYLNRLFPGMNAVDYSDVVLGKWFSRLLTGIYIPVYMMFLNMGVYFFSHIIKIFLPHTPLLAIIAAMVSVSMAGAYLGVESLARTAAIIYPLTFFGNFVTMVILTFQTEMPTGGLSYSLSQWDQIARGAYHLMPMYLGFSIALLLNPFHVKKNPPIIAVVLNNILIICNFVCTILALGYEAAARIKYTFPFVLMLLRLHGFLIERVGISVVILATSFTLVFVSNHLWGLASLTSRVMGTEMTDYKRYVFPVALIVTVSALTLKEAFDEELIDSVLAPVSWVLLLGIPLTHVIVAKLRGFPQQTRTDQN